jgi:adenylate cyclase class IV
MLKVRSVALNVEIKARASDFLNQRKRAEALAGQPLQCFVQEDVFFRAAQGRLKLRLLGPERGELIAYLRPNQAAVKASTYEIFCTADPERLRITLSTALITEGTVRKRRCLFLCGQARIHFDEVEGLGRFIELEVVLRKGQPPAEGHAIAQSLMAHLAIGEEDLIGVAYVDLLQATHREKGSSTQSSA